MSIRISLLLLVGLLVASCTAVPTPKITLSRKEVADRGHITMNGTGFTPKASIISHLKRPDDTEFPGLRFLTDDKGEFTHVIDTYLFQAGIHEVWVMDSTGVSSNVARFEVRRP